MVHHALRTLPTGLLLILSSLTMAAVPAPDVTPVHGARLIGTLTLDGELFHVQGVEVGGPRLWVTSVDRAARRGYVHVFDRRTGAFLRRIDLTDGVRYHAGGLSRTGRSIWVPVAEMRPHSSTVLVEIDADSFAIRRRIAVADHLGFVAAEGDRLVAGNWDAEQFHLIDAAGRQPPRVVANPSPTRFQDMKFVGGRLVGGGYLTPWSGAIDWIDPRTMRVERTLAAGALGPIRPIGRGGPFTGEGMAIDGRELLLLPEDGPSRLFRFRLDA